MARTGLLTNLRYLVIAAVLVSGAVLAQVARPHDRIADKKAPINLEAQIPASFGDWRVDTSIVPVLPSPDLQASLDSIYSQTLARTYVNSKGQRVMLSVAYGNDQNNEATQVHRPEFCYTAQGFQVAPRAPAAISVGDRDITVQHVFATMGPRLEPITYWITLDEHTTLPGIGRKLEQIRYGLKGEIADGMLVRVSTIGADETGAYGVHQEFVRALRNQMSPDFVSRYFGARS